MTLQIRASEQYFHVVLFIMLYKGVLPFMPVDETLVCDHSIESYLAVLSCGTVMLYKVVPTLKCVDQTLVCDHCNKRY